jgi:hypothetical protein
MSNDRDRLGKVLALAINPGAVTRRSVCGIFGGLTQRLAGYMDTMEEASSGGVRPISSVRQQSQMAELSIGRAIDAYKSRGATV